MKVTAVDPPDTEDDSLVQPGRQISEFKSPFELSGTLTTIGELAGSITKKISPERDGGNYARVSKGVLEKPDGLKIVVAIKSIMYVKEVNKKRFNRMLGSEPFVWMTTRHPNILEFIGYKLVNGMLCIVSPWCQHRSLARYIAENQGIRGSEKLKLLCDAASGLAHLHSLNPLIAHGNLKPENVVVKDNIQAALCDLEVSRMFVGIGGASELTTMDGMTRGTPGYQAKELLQDNAPPASGPGDVYALGGLILAALSGKNPFWQKRNAASRIAAVCMDQTPCPKDHSFLPAADSLWALLKECWSANYAARPAVETVRQKLESETKWRSVLEYGQQLGNSGGSRPSLSARKDLPRVSSAFIGPCNPTSELLVPSSLVSGKEDPRSPPTIPEYPWASLGRVSKMLMNLTRPMDSEIAAPTLVRPDSDVISLVQPGYWILDDQIPFELSGTLKKVQQLICLVEKTPKEVDSGAYADVFRGAYERPDGSTLNVAIKCVRPIEGVDQGTFTMRIKRETFIWKKISHPNILEFVGYQVVEGAPWLVSPFCRHRHLSYYIANNPRVRDSEKLKLASPLRDAARGLAYLHSLTPVVVHGNIKAENVLVKDNLEAALCDFGVSRIQLDIMRISGLTRTNEVSGVGGYQEKEAFLGGAATTAGDVHAFGALIRDTMGGKHSVWKDEKVTIPYHSVRRPRTSSSEGHSLLRRAERFWGPLLSEDPAARPTMETVIQMLERGEIESDSEYIPNPPMTSTTRGAARLGDPVACVPPPSRDSEAVVCEIPQPLSGTLTKMGEPIARGAHGDVYKGIWDPPSAQIEQVVIKCLRLRDETQSEFTERRIKRETAIWQMATHPNVLPFLGYQIFEKIAMLASPWCPNGDLATYVGRNPKLTRNQKIKFVCGAARGLAYLHSLNPPIFHGDIKPQNVVVQNNLEAALCDFGISKLILDEGEHSGFTTWDACSGTAGYQPKEILIECPPTTAADVYAFGGLTLATISGKPPFWKMKRDTAKIYAISHDQTPDPVDHPQLPQEDIIWGLLQECWRAEPPRRPSMPEVLRRLEAEMDNPMELLENSLPSTSGTTFFPSFLST